MEKGSDELRSRAERIARDKLGFLIHLVVYVGINSMLVFIWYIIATSGGIDVWTFMGLGGGSVFPWFLIPIIGWGIGLLYHYLVAYRGAGYMASLEKKEYEKLKRLRKM